MAQILIIEDDSQLLQLLDVAFRKHGHSVTTALNGEKALAIIKAKSIDVVITDIIMPDFDGLELLNALAEIHPRPTVIAMSGGSQRIDSNLMLATAKHLKADMLIPKPVTPSQLLEAVDKVLQKDL